MLAAAGFDIVTVGFDGQVHGTYTASGPDTELFPP
jgi:hypothetical protein